MEGVLISIKKRMLNAINNDMCEDSFFIWGFYDLLDISKISRWSDFMSVVPLNRNSFDCFSNEVQVKLIYPRNINDLLDYPCVDYVQYDVAAEQFKNKPLLSVILISFTKEGISKNGLCNLLKMITQRLSNEFDKFDNSKKPAFSVYASIGFMDAAVLCRSNSFAAVADAVTMLRDNSTLLASTYMLPCVLGNASDYDSWLNNSDDDKTKLSIQSTLKPGVAYENFQWIFQKNLETIEDANSYNFYKILGNYDTLMVSDIPASKLSVMYTGEEMLLKPPYLELLTTTKTLIQVKSELMDNKPKFTNTQNPASLMDAKRDAQKQFIEEICEHFSDDSCKIVSDSVKNSLVSLANLYFDVTNSQHTFDVRDMMDSYLIAILQCFRLLKKPIFHYELTEIRFNTSMNIFLDEFNSLVSDFARVDRHMFEERWMKNPSVGSASKLLMVYHLCLKQVVNIFSKKSSYTFLMTSNNVYRIQTDSIFNFFVPNQVTGEEHLFAILRIPERGLYNVSHTLFHIMHEAFHFIGDRLRIARNDHIVASVSMYYLTTLIDVFWKSSSERLSDMISYLDEEYKRDTLVNIINNCRQSYEKEFFLKCKDTISQYIESIAHVHPVYMRFWQEDLLSAMNELSDYIIQMAKKIYMDILFQALNALHEISHGKVHIVQGISENTKALLNKSHRKLIEDYELSFDDHANAILDVSSNEAITCMEAYEAIIDGCREAYSDICSIVVLQSSLSDYLASFITLNLDDMLPIAGPSAIRLYCVVKVCFPDNVIEFPQSKELEDHINTLLSFADDKFKQIAQILILYLLQCKKQLDNDLLKSNVDLSDLRNIYKSAHPNSIADIPNVNETVIWQILDKWSTSASTIQ